MQEANSSDVDFYLQLYAVDKGIDENIAFYVVRI
jgi:hypothetical protein